MSNGASTVAYLDQEFLLGPEGAHINMSGISGCLDQMPSPMANAASSNGRGSPVAAGP